MPATRSLIKRLIPALTGVALVAVLLTLLLLARDVRDHILGLDRASSANAQWSLSQPDIELMQMLLAGHKFSRGQGTLADFRRRYDIFYSRILLMETTPYFSRPAAISEFSLGLQQAARFLKVTEPILDGPDTGLVRALPGVMAAGEQLQPMLRELSLRGLQERGQTSDQRRERLRDTLTQLMVVSATLMVVLLLAMTALALMVRRARRHSARIHQASLRVRAIIGASQDAILVLNPSGRIVESNPAAARIFDIDQCALEGMRLQEVLPDWPQTPPPPPGVTGPQQRVSGQRRDGSRFPAEGNLTTILDEALSLRICFVRDISDRLAAEDALVTARDQALAGEQAKADVLAVMSHEMRTPLNGILGTLDLIDLEKDPLIRTSYGKVVRTSAEQLLVHVNNVLDIARMDAMSMEIRDDAFDAGALVDAIVTEQAGAALRNGNELRAGPRDASLAWVCGDPARLHQVLLNLVSNAVKFTRDGQVSLQAQRRADGMAVFEVRDTGIGIPPGDLGRIFDEFVTLNTAYDRDSQGTGLGLAISRRMVVLMGGRVEVESQPGEGSVFRVILPLPVPAVSALPAEDDTAGQMTDDPGVAPLDILVVEDNAINRFVVRNILQSDTHIVTEAHNGQEALDLTALRRFDLILMDISMPGLDGLETTRRIRLGDGPNRETPVVALTAHAHAADLERFARGGIARTLTKPLRRKALRDLLSDYAPPLSEPGALFDTSTAKELRDALGPGAFEDLRSRFEAETEAGLAALRERSEADEETADLAHKIAGSAALFGLHGLHRALNQLEDHCRLTPTDTSGLCRAQSALHPEWLRARALLRQI